MPQKINMEQNDGPIILDDPFLGADVDDEEDDAEKDFGDDVGEEVIEDETDTETEEESDTETEEESEEETEEEAEEETEEEAEEETEEESEDETAAAPKDKDQRIPKQRFDEVNERRKAAEKKLADYEAAQEAAKAAAEGAFDFDAAEKQYMEFVVDGEFEKAQAIRKEIRAAERAEVTAVARQSAADSREATKADLIFQDTVTELEAAYPMMVKGNEGYDQSLVDEVLSLHEGFLNQGMEANAAIRKAVRYVAKDNDLKAAGDEPPPPKVPAKKTPSQADVKAKVKAKTSQPQQLPKGGDREAAMDMSSMSEEEFDALPESKKRELRGDFV